MKKEILIILLFCCSTLPAFQKPNFLLGASYSYFINYQDLSLCNSYSDNHVISLYGAYPFVKNKVNIGLEIGADLSPYFNPNAHNDRSTGLRISNDTNILMYDSRQHWKTTELRTRASVPISLFINSFFVEIAPEVDFDFSKYSSLDTTIWYSKNNRTFVPYDTVYDNPNSLGTVIDTWFNYSIGYQWNRIQLKLTGKGFYWIGLSIRYLFIVPW
jgi:hypothetical protein